MSHTLGRYDIYKDSGVEWLGEVPAHWEVNRVKDELDSLDHKRIPLSGEIRGQMTEQTYDYYGASGVIDKVEGYIFDESTILIGEDGANLYSRSSPLAFIANGKYWVNNHAHILKPRKGDISFFCYLLEALDYTTLISGSAQPKLTAGQLNRVLLMVPPFVEQASIAAYLDEKTAQLDRKIELLGQKAAQYGKLKQSLINETVTRGLDKTVAMKDSGIEWIGEVPAHWDVRRLKELSDIQNSNVDKKSHEHETPVQLCNYVDVYKNEFIDASLDFMWATADESEIKRFTIKKNDVLITKDSETCDDIAIPALATESLDDVLCGYHLAQFRVKNKLLLGAYLFRLLQSKNYGFRFVISAKGITRVGLGQSAIADSLTPVPPLQEQQAIAAYLDEKTAHIDRIVAALNSQIDKLKELRKTLINDVVTGKICILEQGGTGALALPDAERR